MNLTLATLICVLLCGSPRFQVREAANKRLEVLCEVAPAVVFAGESNADPEIAGRCRRVMNAWYARHAAELVDVMEPGIGWPWCDSLTLGVTDPDTGVLRELEWDRAGWNLHDRARFLDMAQRQGFTPGHPWNAWREATRLWICELIGQRKDAAYFLRCLCEGHLQQCRHYGYSPRHGLPVKGDW